MYMPVGWKMYCISSVKKYAMKKKKGEQKKPHKDFTTTNVHYNRLTF